MPFFCTKDCSHSDDAINFAFVPRLHNRKYARGAAAEGAEGRGAHLGTRPSEGSTAVERRQDATRGRPISLQSL